MPKVRIGRVKASKKKSGVSAEDKDDLQKMFSQITGSSDADREILIPKIDKIYKNIISYNTLFSTLLKFEPFTKEFDEYKFWFDNIAIFLTELIKTTNVDITKIYSEDMKDKEYHALDDISLNVFYKKLKDNDHLRKIVITGSNLSAYKNHLLSADKLDDVFIYREPGLILQPLAFSSLDLKIIWGAENISDTAKQFILSILKFTYKIGIDVYDTITSPDVDIKKFSSILVKSIGNMKKMIPRCDNAFKIIENSVSMLENNFKNYFRGSVEAGNPNIIIESFIVDISTSQKASPRVAGEFRQIVNFLKTNNAQNNDPKVKKLFSMLNNQFTSLDRELGIKTPNEPESSTPIPKPEAKSAPLEPLLQRMDELNLKTD